MKLPAHFFVSFDGSLSDTRNPNWAREPLRERYSMLAREIRDTIDIRAALRHGSHTQLGGYECFFITSDGACLCFDCVRQEYRNVAQSVNCGFNEGWRVTHIECSANIDGGEWCAHCNRFISAYCTEQEYIESMEGE